MRIYSDRFEVLTIAIEEWTNREIRISKRYDEYRVNWASLGGGSSPDEARAFADKIIVISDIVEMINAEGYKFVNVDEFDPGIDSGQKFWKWVDTVEKWLSDPSGLNRLNTWFDDGAI